MCLVVHVKQPVVTILVGKRSEQGAPESDLEGTVNTPSFCKSCKTGSQLCFAGAGEGQGNSIAGNQTRFAHHVGGQKPERAFDEGSMQDTVFHLWRHFIRQG